MGKDAKQGLISYQFAFGMNRLADFQQNITLAGNVKNTSVSDYLAQLANGIDSTNFGSSDYDNTLYALAWRTRLIDNLPNDPNSYASIQSSQNDTDYTMLQTQGLKNRGRLYEWYISGGLNLSNKIYLGASLIIQDVNFGSEVTYQESLLKSSLANNYYQSSSITSNLSTKGSGFGGRIGMIIRPNDYFRVGFSYQTPVILNLKDVYSNTLSMTYNNGTVYSQPANSRDDFFEYSITTPGRIGLQTAVILPHLGLLSFDYDLVDYSTGRISADGNSQQYILSKNADMSRKYQQAANYRLGIEVKADFMKLRAGYAYMGSPYNPNEVSEENGCRYLYSAGLGFALDEQASFDFGLNYITGKNYYKTYETNALSASTQFNRIVFAIGTSIKF
jgi:long-subunit fatty acid transport protein